MRTAIEELGLDIAIYDQYFERKKRITSKYRETATKVHLGNSYIIPDSIFNISTDKEQHLFCLEFHRGWRITKVEKQLKQYAYALANGAVSIKYNLLANPKILVLFEKQSALETTYERLAQDQFYTYVKPFYFFKCYDDLSVTPLDHRVSLDGKECSIIPSHLFPNK